MSEETNKDKKNCGSKGKLMFAYGIIQLSSRIITAIALATIAWNFCSINQKARIFNECIEEVKQSGKSSSTAVNFCNGGK